MHRPKPSKPHQLRDPRALRSDFTGIAHLGADNRTDLGTYLGSARNLVAESTSLRGRRADTKRRKGTRKAADRENCRRAPTTVRYAATPGAKADAVFLERSDHLSNSGPDGAVFFTDGSILVDGKTFGIIKGSARDDTSAALCTIGPSDPSCRCNSILRSLELFGRARVQAYCAIASGARLHHIEVRMLSPSHAISLCVRRPSAYFLPPSFGSGGRFRSESVGAFRRNRWPHCLGFCPVA
jgi:hypothetical protein